VNSELMKTLRDRLGERARFNRPLAPRTTWGAGGPVWGLCRVRDAAEAAFVIRAARGAGMPWMPLGRGSNLLVRDGGYPGVMLRLTGPLARLAPQGSAIQAGAGAGLPAAVRLAARRALDGLGLAVHAQLHPFDPNGLV
jgi:UDP-N-acetylmuramate dehydrogenase